MAGSKSRRTVGWSALLAEPGGPEGAHDQVLGIVREIADGPLRAIDTRALLAFDDAVAAVATLRGPSACREALEAARRIVAEINVSLTLFPDMVSDLSLLSILSSVAVSETINVPLELSAVDYGQALGKFSVQKLFSKTEKVTAALVALAVNRPDQVPFIVGTGAAPKVSAADPTALVRTLARAQESGAGGQDLTTTWEAFLAGFPAALAAKETAWNHLLLAARIVMAQLGSIPMADVADALHRRVVELAAAKPS